MTTRIDTIMYQAAHGKLPRGRGTWLFELDLNGAKVVWSPGCLYTYADACAWVRKEAKKHGASNIKALS